MKKLKSRKNFFYILTSLLLSIFVILYVLNMVFGSVSRKHILADGYQYANYDVRLENNVDWYVTDYLNDRFQIDDYLMISGCYQDFELRSGKNSTKDFNFIAILPSESFDKLRQMLMPDELVRHYDETLLTQQNAMALSSSQAYLLNVGIGDTVEFCNGTYVVALIYEASVYWAYEDSFSAYVRAEAVQDCVYTGEGSMYATYIKFDKADKAKALQYIHDNYCKQDVLYSMYGDEFLNRATETEKNEAIRQAYNIPEISYAIAIDQLRDNTIKLTTYTVLGIALIMALQIYENHKQLMINCKRYAIYRVLGYSKKKFFWCRFIKALFYGSFTCASAIFILCKWRFVVITKMALYELLFPIPFIVLAVAIIVSFIALYEFRDLMLVSILKSEE